MMERLTDDSPQHLARIAGGLYLIIIVGGVFALGYVPAAIVVPGDAAATAHNILAKGDISTGYGPSIGACLFDNYLGISQA